MKRGPRSTPAGQHRPVLLDEVLDVLAPREGAVLVDATVGWAGHSVELLRRVGPTGRLIGVDLDPDNLPRARERLEALGLPFSLHHSNFAALPAILAAEGVPAVAGLLADLGMSSMQVDDAERGFSYVRDGPLDMRMDRTRGRSAAQVLATISQEELAGALRDLGDEEDAERIAAAIVAARDQRELTRTSDLARVIQEASPEAAGRQPSGQPEPEGWRPAASRAGPGGGKQPWRLHPSPGRWNLHPAARTFQALRILVNRELANLTQLLRVLPDLLEPGGRAAIISFHSGEDRLVKAAFREGLHKGIYESISPEPIRPTPEERQTNPRSRSAKLRWARRLLC